ncbi:hypothetical protein MKW98_014681, partial [Papaver atlanticum]
MRKGRLGPGPTLYSVTVVLNLVFQNGTKGKAGLIQKLKLLFFLLGSLRKSTASDGESVVRFFLLPHWKSK